ncbi:MAG TPA: tetratricopeptide repeat protein [Geobacteraceae bacterium]|nr:tetratricopeptide repeat protein [Geobacteraceae bacterium]
MKKYTVGCMAMLAALISMLVYLRSVGCDFVNLDDPLFILNNRFIRKMDAEFFSWAFAKSLDFWLPLTWLSFAVDYHFWGVNPKGYHLTNTLLHAANTGLVVLIADRLLGERRATWELAAGSGFLYPLIILFAGLLFGIHPLRVESVVWATERKDVLNGLFSLGSIFSYLRYAQTRVAGGEERGARSSYLLSFALMLLSLMAKPISVVLPAMFLVADWYPLERFRSSRALSLFVEKTPFFLLSLAISILTISFGEEKQILISYAQLPLSLRLIVSGNAVFEYCRLMLLPVGIIPFNVIPDGIPMAFAVKTVMVVFFSACCLYAVRSRSWLAATWIAFIIPLLPVLGFIQNGDQAFASRYTYLPSVVPSIAAAGLFATVCTKSGVLKQRFGRELVVSVTVMVLGIYAVTTLRLVDVWQNTETLWSRVIEFQPLGRAYSDRGIYRMLHGNSVGAVADFSAAIEIAKVARPSMVYNLYAFRGVALRDVGRYEEAIRDLNSAIGLHPHPTYYYYRGLILRTLGRTRDAEDDFNRAGPNPPPIDWF